jgi:hypothetical protein
MRTRDQTLTELQDLFGELGTNLFICAVAKNRKRATKLLGWCNSNRIRIKELSAVVKSFDVDGLEAFGRTITFHSKEPEFDAVRCAKNALNRRQLIKTRLALKRCAGSWGERKATLANGLNCVITYNGNWDSFSNWFACIKLKKRRKVRLSLSQDQAARLLQNATKKIASLRRMQPAQIDYWNGRTWVEFQQDAYKIVMRAIAERTALETIILLSA